MTITTEIIEKRLKELYEDLDNNARIYNETQGAINENNKILAFLKFENKQSTQSKTE